MPRLRSLFSLCAVLLLSLAAHADTCNGFSNNLVSNCSFETGSFSNWTGTSTTNIFSGVDSLTPYSGRYGAYLGSDGSTAALTQNVNTVAGGLYLIEFALMNDTSPSLGYTNSFALQFGGNTIFSQSAIAAGPYMLYSFTVGTTLTSTPLSFVTRNDAGDFDLDSISVTPSAAISVTPEPSSWLLVATGFAACVSCVKRRSLGRVSV